MRKLILVTLASLAVCTTLPRSSTAQAPEPAQAAAMKKDQLATIRFLRLRLEKVQMLLKRGSESEAAKLEAECVRHEVKCLQRCLWMMKQDRRLAPKARALAAEIERLSQRDPGVSLEERRRNEFRIHPLVTDPLGVTVLESKDPAALTASAGRKTAEEEQEEADRPERAPAAPAPPAAAEPPPPADGEAGSAGSAGSSGERR